MIDDGAWVSLIDDVMSRPCSVDQLALVMIWEWIVAVFSVVGLVSVRIEWWPVLPSCLHLVSLPVGIGWAELS